MYAFFTIALLATIVIPFGIYAYGFINAYASIKHIRRINSWQRVVFCHRIGDRGWRFNGTNLDRFADAC